MRKRRLYWTSQIVGWGAYVVLIAFFNSVNGLDFDVDLYLNLISTFLLGIGISHAYRYFIIRYNWLRMKLGKLIPIVILASFILSTVYYGIHTTISDLLIQGRALTFEWIDFLQSLINLSALFLLWTLIYWSFHFIENYKKEEIKNLKWEANRREMELNKIRSQLNPHFIFNSMNSIRAMVDESPVKAKNLITQLSNILRNSLYMDKKPLIPFEEEMSLVEDYLHLEKARLEDRLNYELDIDPACKAFGVPPLMLQTLVENGIKHGIATLEKGGELKMQASVNEGNLNITISNTGKIKHSTSGRKGIGLDISKQRLELLYGENASLELKEESDKVVAYVVLPKESQKQELYESIDN